MMLSLVKTFQVEVDSIISDQFCSSEKAQKTYKVSTYDTVRDYCQFCLCE